MKFSYAIFIILFFGCFRSQNQYEQPIFNYLNNIHGVEWSGRQQIVYVLNLDGCHSCVELHLRRLSEVSFFCDELTIVLAGKTTNQKWQEQTSRLAKNPTTLIDTKNHAVRYGIALVKPTFYFLNNEILVEWPIPDHQVEFLADVFTDCSVDTLVTLSHTGNIN